MDVNLRHLYYFFTVAKIGNLVEAARELGLTPPTICTQIKTLENSVEQKLFMKAGRGLSLTESGRGLLSKLEPVFERLETICADLRNGRSNPQ